MINSSSHYKTGDLIKACKKYIKNFCKRVKKGNSHIFSIWIQISPPWCSGKFNINESLANQ